MSTNNTSKPIRELLTAMDSEELVLPEIQREFIWSKKSVMLLFDSLDRGLPIGHMLVWKTRQRIRGKEFQHATTRRTKYQEIFYGSLLDGQQRLTAVSRVRDSDQDFRLLVDLSPEGDDEVPESNSVFCWWWKWAEKAEPWVGPLA